ncbi:MAG: BPSS1780 family membrane protein [Aeromonas sp.]|uniref:BPSS1780 family membrane protein n=1 Tax=Aeromonas sp. TaxID=647 RepID=UPI002FC9D040
MNSEHTLRSEPKRHPIGRGWVWVRTGFDIFNKGMGASVAMIALWFVVGLVLDRLPAGGFISQLLYMVWGAGWVAVAQRGYAGHPLQFADFFAGFRQRLTPLILGGLLVLCLFSLIVLVCATLLHMWGLTGLLSQDPETLTLTVAQAQGFLLCLLLGLALMVPVLMAITFAPALIFFHGVGVWQAARLSFKGCLRNMWPFLWWGLLGAVLILFGVILFLVGLLVVLPAINYSIYAAYRDIYLEESEVTEQAPPAKEFGFEA